MDWVKTGKRGCACGEEEGHAAETCRDQTGVKKLMGRATLQLRKLLCICSICHRHWKICNDDPVLVAGFGAEHERWQCTMHGSK